MYLLRLYSNILNNYDHTENIENNIYFKSINKFLILLTSIYVFQSIFYFSLFGLSFFTGIHICMFFYFFGLLLIKKKEYVIVHVDYYTFTSFIVISTFVTFVSYISNYSRNLELFYFPILTSIPFFYTIKKIRQVISIVLYIIFLFVIIKFLKPHLGFKIVVGFEEIINIENLCLCFFATIVNVYFIIEQKENKIKLIYEKNEIEDNLNDLEGRYSELMRKQFILNNLNNDKINEIYHLAETNSPLFIDKFYEFFPAFKDKLALEHPDLNYNEVYLCILLKLNFDTKKIATISRQTVRAVESKKYRLKKKLDLGIEWNIQEYFISF